MTLRFKGPSWNTTHLYGEGEKNIARKLAYYHTPKCASMWMRDYLAQQTKADRWEPTNFLDEPLDDYIKIVIVRDPVERWISHNPAGNKVGDFDSDGYTGQIFDDLKPWQADEHTAPQFDFIDGLDLSNAVYFMCDDTLSVKMQHFFHSQGFENYQAPEIINASSNNSFTQQSSKTWRNILSRPEYLNQFKIAYKQDYDLLESIKLYAISN
jgi:hypothetical protein